MNVSVADVKANLAEILRKAAAGEEIVVTKHGQPYVRIVPNTVQRGKLPRLGAFVDFPFYMADDFDELGPEWDEYTKE